MRCGAASRAFTASAEPTDRHQLPCPTLKILKVDPGLVLKLLLPTEKAQLTGLTPSAAPGALYLALEILQVLRPGRVFPLEARSFLVAARGKAGLPREEQTLQVGGLSAGAWRGAAEVRRAAQATIPTEELQRRAGW